MIELKFLGHVINPNEYRPLESKVDAVKKFPRFTNVKQLQRFLGFVGYYCKSIKNVSAILDPLYKLLSPHKNSVKPVEWTPWL